MKKSSLLPLLSLLVIAVIAIYAIGPGLDQRRYSNDVIEELTYFPSGRMLQVADLGFGSLLADAMWLRGIQYYGEHRKTDREYPLAQHIFSTITNLDPGFIGAYRFGALVLADDAGTPAGAIDLLRKGIRSNPESWEIPFDLGFIYFMNLDDYRKAAHYFRIASRYEGVPDIAKRFAAFAYRRSGRTDIAEALWEGIYRSSQNRLMRESAQLALKDIALDKTAAALGEEVKRYALSFGRSPQDLAELVRAGLVSEIPHDPFGGSYFLDPSTGSVLSTTSVMREGAAKKTYLERRIRQFADCNGRLPQSLDELKTQGFVVEIPRVAGARVGYDPATGRVTYESPWKEDR